MLSFLVSLALTASPMPICPPGPRDNCVVDGDSIWWEGERIRLMDIDAPEMQGRCEYETRLAVQSRDRLAQLLANGFRIHRDGTDRYGRTLAGVTVNGRSAGDMLVAEGLARTWSGRRKPRC